MLSPRDQSGLEAKILASVSASKPWPWTQTPGLGLASVCSWRTSSQEETDQSIGHHTMLRVNGKMIEDSYCLRQNEKLKLLFWS